MCFTFCKDMLGIYPILISGTWLDHLVAGGVDPTKLEHDQDQVPQEHGANFTIVDLKQKKIEIKIKIPVLKTQRILKIQQNLDCMYRTLNFL